MKKMTQAVIATRVIARAIVPMSRLISESAKTTPPPSNVSIGLKRKDVSISSPQAPSSKRVQIAIDSDDDLDEGEIQINVLPLRVTSLRADASFAISASGVASLDVLASAATVAEKIVQVDASRPTGSNSPNQVAQDLDATITRSPAEEPQHIGVEDNIVLEMVRAEDSGKGDGAHSPPFISTPSPQLIQDVLDGFSERCAKNGCWLMGLPTFHDSSSHREAEKEFVEENDLISSWAALDVSAAKTASLARLQCGVATKALQAVCNRRKKSLARIAKLEDDREFLHCELDRISNEKKAASDLVRKFSGEKRNLLKENKELLARQRTLERSIIDHQEVSRQRADSEDNLENQVVILEKSNEQLELARKQQEEKCILLSEELENCRQ
uniref:Uncharacterized protein n=1 Tax=Oryza punctata TaxID=4537 RepID=A0A0E0KAZ5_ORYPU